MLCSDQTAADLKRAGKSGQKTPVETSPKTSAAPTLLETTNNEGETSIAWTSGQEGWAKESSMKSMGCASAAAVGGGGGGDGKLRGGTERTDKPSSTTLGGGLESASATTFSDPGVCLISVVNSEMLLARRLRRRDADHGGDERFVVCEELKLPTL